MTDSQIPEDKPTTAISAPAAAKKAAAKKPAQAAKKQTAKRAVKKDAAEAAKTAGEKAGAGKTAAKKAAAKKPAAKKAGGKREAKEAAVRIVLEYGEKSVGEETLLENARNVYRYDLGKDVGEIRSLDVYVKPEENRAYFVVNGEEEGSFVI